MRNEHSNGLARVRDNPSRLVSLSRLVGFSPTSRYLNLDRSVESADAAREARLCATNHRVGQARAA